jgi:hypothetical protein
MRTNGKPGTPRQSGTRPDGEPAGIRDRLRALAGATLEWVRGRLGFARPARGQTDGSDLPRPADRESPVSASGRTNEQDADLAPRVVDWGRTDEQGRQQNRERNRELTPALPGDDVRARERGQQLLIYEPEQRGAYIESDTWQEIER